MLKRIIALVLLLSLVLSLVGCLTREGDEASNEIKNQKQIQSNDYVNSDLVSESTIEGVSAKIADVAVSEEKDEDLNEATSKMQKDEFVMLARVSSKENHLAIEVIESKYATGTYWVVTSSDTLYYDAQGSLLSYDDIDVGDTVLVAYTGQVMLSLPPQIIALTIVKQ